jgi:WD40 repeat protein
MRTIPTFFIRDTKMNLRNREYVFVNRLLQIFVPFGIFFLCLVQISFALPPDKDFNVVIQTNHTGPINTLLYSKSYHQVISASNDNFIRVWSTVAEQEFGRLVHILKGHTENVTAIALQPEGKNLVSGGKDEKLILWNLLTGKKEDEYLVSDKIIAITYSDDPTQNSIAVALENEKSVRFFDVTTKLRELKQTPLSTKGTVTSMISFNSWQYVACGTTNGELVIIDVNRQSIPKVISVSTSKIVTLGKLNDDMIIWMDEKGTVGTFITATSSPSKETWSAVALEKVNSASYNPENHIFTFVTTQGTVKWVDAFTRRSGTKNIKKPESSLSVENNIIVVSDDGVLRWFNKSTMQAIPTPNAPTNAKSQIIKSVAVSTHSIATLNQGYELWVWNLENGSAVYYDKFIGTGGAEFHLAYNDNGERLIVGAGVNKPLGMLYKDSLYTDFGINSRNVKAIAFIPGTDNFISSHSDNKSFLNMWDAKTQKRITFSQFLEQPQIGMSISATECITIEKQLVRIWDIQTLTQKDSIRIPTGQLTACALQPSDNKIAVGYLDGTIEIFTKIGNGYKSNVKSKVHNNKKINRLEWLDNSLFSCSKDNSLRQSTAALKEVAATYDHAAEVQDFALFPNHRYVASVGNDGTCIISSLKDSLKPNMNLITVAPDSWVAVSNDGLFDASTSGIAYVNIVSNNRSKPLENYISILEKPGILAKVIGGAGEKPTKSRNDIAKLIESVPPSVTILSPISVDRIKKSKINVTVEINNTSANIEELKITNNGTIYTVIPQNELRGLMTIQVPLVAGKNLLKVEGSAQTGVRGFDTVSIMNESTQETKPTLFVLAVGISNYKNKKFELKYARKDAESFCEAIKDNLSTNEYQSVYIETLFDENATYRKITEKFEEIAGKIKLTDRFIFYYAGHGTLVSKNEDEEFYLVLQDVMSIADIKSTDGVEDRGISAHAIENKFRTVKCEKKAIILDACHAGSVKDLFDDQSGTKKVLSDLNRNAGVYLMSSALLSQQAHENSTLQHGLFTMALIEGLRGRAVINDDDKVSFSTLQAYIASRIPKLRIENNIDRQEQTPLYKSSDTDVFVITQKKN